MISGKSLKLGQVIAAVIASVLKMTFKSSLGLGCLQGTHFLFFFGTKFQRETHPGEGAGPPGFTSGTIHSGEQQDP